MLTKETFLSSHQFQYNGDQVIKLNKTIYRRLLSQAEEAKELELTKLADGLLNAIGPVARDDDEIIQLSHDELTKDIYGSLWKMALDVAVYHDLKMVDAQKMHQVLSGLTDKLLSTLESSLNVEDNVGAFEPKLPGESK